MRIESMTYNQMINYIDGADNLTEQANREIKCEREVENRLKTVANLFASDCITYQEYKKQCFKIQMDLEDLIEYGNEIEQLAKEAGEW